MSVFNTAYPAFLSALESSLTAGVSSARVSLGWPAGGLEAKHVYIPADGSMEVLDEISGFGQRDEDLKGEVRILVQKTSDEFFAVAEEAFGILDEVEAALDSDRTLGGLVSYVHITGFEVKEGVENSERWVGINAKVTADATT